MADSSHSPIKWDAIPIPQWFCQASEDELREFVCAIDDDVIPAGARKVSLLRAFFDECGRRAGSHNESLNQGESI